MMASLSLLLSTFSATLTAGRYIFTISVVALLAKYVIRSRRPRDFPPGPRAIPLFGNLPQLPSTKTFLRFHELGKEYGSIIGLKLGPQNVVVLNSYKHVRALFDKKGAIYSSRPDNYIGNRLVCPDDTHILLVPYGPGWRTLRKVVQSLLNITAVDNILPIQNAEATQTIVQLLEDPAGYYDHIRRYSTAVILASVFGQRGARFDSPKIQALYHVQDQFTAILEQGATPPVDAFPFLQYLPEFMCSWKKRAKEIRQLQRSLYFDLLRETKARIGSGKGDCFMKQILEEHQEKNGLDDEHVAYLGGILMEAGSDTTASTLFSFLLAMIKYPETLKKAQQEVDRVCGTSRSPTSNDIKELQYIAACMNETLRWRPVAAGGIPHMLTQEDTYEGYVLPKGTIVFANAWAIHMDEAEYENPEEFIPERFLQNKFGTRGLVDAPYQDHRRVTYGFGAGRRVCPGQRLAENSLMVNMAKLVWAFNILPGSEHVDAGIKAAYTDGFLTCPKKFPIQFLPRSKLHEQVIMQEFEAAKDILKQYEG